VLVEWPQVDVGLIEDGDRVGHATGSWGDGGGIERGVVW